jgi:hypothetical protein
MDQNNTPWPTQLQRELHHKTLDLHRAKLCLTTARRLVNEERQEINGLRRDLLRSEEENDFLRQQLWELSTVRSSQLGLEPREPLKVFPMEDT